MKEAFRHGKDPAALTPYEQEMWDLRTLGLTYRQIADIMGQNVNSVTARFKTIKEKVELQNEEINEARFG